MLLSTLIAYARWTVCFRLRVLGAWLKMKHGMQGSPSGNQCRALIMYAPSSQQQLQRAQELAKVSTLFISCAFAKYSHMTLSRVSVSNSSAAGPFGVPGYRTDHLCAVAAKQGCWRC